MAVDRDDKIALGVISTVVAGVTIAILLAIRWFFAGVTGVLNMEDGGVGWQSAFVASLVISFVFVLAFAAFAGDGVIGEFGFMVLSYFLMVLFFTCSIAIIL